MRNSLRIQDSIWRNLWIAPRSAIRRQIDRAPTQVIIWLALIHGALFGLYSVDSFNILYPATQPKTMYALCILIGMAFGVVQLYVLSWLFTFCGQWIKGKGSYTAVKCAVGWSFYPLIVAAIFGLLTPLVMPTVWLQALVGMISIVAFIWGLVVLFHVIAEAHRFKSAWQGVGAVLIAMVLIFAVLYVFLFIQTLFF